MNNNVFLPCKSCGHMLSDSALSCPNCGDATPFCYDVEMIKQMGETDAKKINGINDAVIIIDIILSILLYFLTHIWWVSLIVFFVIFGVFRYFFGRKIEVSFDNAFYDELDFYKRKHSYTLSDQQLEHWKNTAYRIYFNVRVKKTQF